MNSEILLLSVLAMSHGDVTVRTGVDAAVTGNELRTDLRSVRTDSPERVELVGALE